MLIMLIPVCPASAEIGDSITISVQSSKTLMVRPFEPVEYDILSAYNAVYESLVTLDDDYLPQPCLAESWEESASGRTWTFYLRQDVRFSDGTPLTAQDVVASAEYILARAKNEVHGRILEKIGVDRIVYPEQEMGTRVGKFMDDRDFMDWIELSPEYSLVEVRVPEEWVGKTLTQLNLRRTCCFNVVGLKDEDGIIVTPDPDMPLTANLMMYIIGHNADLEKIKQ